MVPLKAVVSFLVLSMLGFGVSAQELQIVGPNSKTVLRSGAAPAQERLLVKLRPGKVASFQREMRRARALPGVPELFLVPVPQGLSAREAAQRYARRADVLYAEPDGIATLAAVPGDTRWSEQWDMVKISAPAAWDVQTNSSDLVVAVVDSGIDFSHPDLQANLWTDPLDGSHGVTCRNGTVTTGGLDDNGHGTHVAGTIGAVGNNATGIAGINWSVQLLSLKAFDQYGNANISDVVACMNKLVALRQRGFNIRVANHSWSTNSYSQALRDAFASAEAAGILHVAAAGNFTTDLDFVPAYPAAFPGRGILAVSSTSSTDGMAPFTNFGHVEVDLAAPGHNILSTVPTGTCSHCDPSGYKLLSGTSMATPHVSGVAAALFHLNPLLTPAEARDLLLNPASFDQLPIGNNFQVLSSTRAGRLNFAKVLANPLLTTPQLNGFPVISAPARVVRSAGTPVTLTATASDPDGDTLAFEWGKPLRNLLYGIAMNRALPPGNFNPSIAQTNPYTFTAPSLAITATSEYKALVNDGRGGSAAASTWVTFPASPAPGLPPTGQISVTPASGPVGTQVQVTYSGTDPEGGALYWLMTSSFQSNCCFTTSQTSLVNLGWPGVFRFNAQSIDPEMNLSEVSTTVVRIGDATGEPPVARLTLSTTSGPAPLTVSYDATGSYDPDGEPLTYFVIACEAWVGGSLTPEPPTGTCVFDTPGPHAIGLRVQDPQGYADDRVFYVMVTDTLTPDVAAPAVQIAAPVAGAPVKGTVAIDVSASDDTGVMRVEVYRDSGILLGTDTTYPFSVAWDTANLPLGDHTLYAKAYDQAGNLGVAPTISVSVREAVSPTVALLAPASGATVSGLVTLQAEASDNQSVTRVEFFRDNGILLGTDATAPFSLAWDSSVVTPGAHTLYARAYDPEENQGSSSVASVTVLDSAPPSVAVTAPAAGSTLSGIVTLAADASDNVGVTKVEFFRDSGILLGTDTAAPFSLSWDSTSAAGDRTLYAKAYDQVGNAGTSAPVPVRVRDTVRPVVTITSPANGASVAGAVLVAASVTDNVGVARVDFFLDFTTTLASDTSAPWELTWNSATVAPGAHSIAVRAYDLEGNISILPSVDFTVLDALPPSVSITSPANGSTVARNTNVTISASASDNVGVARVEIYAGSTLLCTDTASPYSCSWRTPKTAGVASSLQARAYDARGNMTSSAVVQVTTR